MESKLPLKGSKICFYIDIYKKAFSDGNNNIKNEAPNLYSLDFFLC